MPNYDYMCASCGEDFEFFQSMNDVPLTRCPSCEEHTLKRKIGTGAGIIFKGSEQTTMIVTHMLYAVLYKVCFATLCTCLGSGSLEQVRNQDLWQIYEIHITVLCPDEIDL